MADLRDEEAKLIRMQAVTDPIAICIDHEHERRGDIRYAVPVGIRVIAESDRWRL